MRLFAISLLMAFSACAGDDDGTTDCKQPPGVTLCAQTRGALKVGDRVYGKYGLSTVADIEDVTWLAGVTFPATIDDAVHTDYGFTQPQIKWGAWSKTYAAANGLPHPFVVLAHEQLHAAFAWSRGVDEVLAAVLSGDRARIAALGDRCHEDPRWRTAWPEAALALASAGMVPRDAAEKTFDWAFVPCH